jgi:E1-E2 ATPase/cation transport ATPase-like protein
MTATATQQPGGGVAWYALPAQDVTARMGVRTAEGLAPADVGRQRAEYGPNEPPPSTWTVARGQLAKLQVPHARVRRSGQIREIESTKLVPGDIVLLEAGDRTNLVFQNTPSSAWSGARTSPPWCCCAFPPRSRRSRPGSRRSCRPCRPRGRAGYQQTGAILGVAGAKLPDFHNLALGLVLCTDAAVGDDGSVIILGWILTWAAVELNMLQRLLDTTSLSGRQRSVVIALSLPAAAIVAVDKAIQLRRQRKPAQPYQETPDAARWRKA